MRKIIFCAAAIVAAGLFSVHVCAGGRQAADAGSKHKGKIIRAHIKVTVEKSMAGGVYDGVKVIELKIDDSVPGGVSKTYWSDIPKESTDILSMELKHDLPVIDSISIVHVFRINSEGVICKDCAIRPPFGGYERTWRYSMSEKGFVEPTDTVGSDGVVVDQSSSSTGDVYINIAERIVKKMVPDKSARKDRGERIREPIEMP